MSASLDSLTLFGGGLGLKNMHFDPATPKVRARRPATPGTITAGSVEMASIVKAALRASMSLPSLCKLGTGSSFRKCDSWL